MNATEGAHSTWTVRRRFVPKALLVGALVAATALACRGKSRPSAAPEPDAPAVARRGRGPSRDVTFLAMSDTHFGYVSESVHAALVGKLDGIAGHPYPPQLGGAVAAPRGLLIAGDLTEWGRQEELARFLAFYGNGDAGSSVKLPVYEVIGNHDKVAGHWVEEAVAARHGSRSYSFDWDDVHFVTLGEAPDDDALAWLARDLDRYEKNVPLVVLFHLALLGPWSTDNWFAEGMFKDRLAAALAGRCVAAIIHGHHHAWGHYTWHGIDVYKPGAVKDDTNVFAVFHLHAATKTVAFYDHVKDTWVSGEAKDLCP